MILAIGLFWFAYQLGWYGYATLQQPVSGGCIGFTDLMLPGAINKVDNCIQNSWGVSSSPNNSSAQNQQAINSIDNPTPPGPNTPGSVYTRPLPGGQTIPGNPLPTG